MRLDKFLCQLNMGSRTEVKNLIRRGQVTVNGAPAMSPEQKIDEHADRIACRGQLLCYQAHVYYMMNKPQGVVSATKDRLDKTVLDLLRPALADQDRKREIVPVGRLDKDTEGLLLLTDDGALAHELLSPGKHVNKTYLVKTAEVLTETDIHALETGVDIGEKRKTLPASVEVLEPKLIRLTIHEGKFHQVKRMLQAVHNEVLALKRVGFGPLLLDETLAPGDVRALTEEEILALQSRPSIQPPVLDDIEAVIFDLDGTLVDSMWIWHDIDVEYLGKYDIPIPDRLQADIEGMSFDEVAVYFKERFAIPDSLEQIKESWNSMAWDKYEREVRLKPGVKTFLDACKGRGIKLGIATSNSRKLLDNISQVHGLHDYFTCTLTGCEITKGKPAPDIYLAVAEKLGVRPEHCLVFEDIIPGIMAGKNAGMKICAVEDAYSADIRIQKQNLADYYIADYTEIVL